MKQLLTLLFGLLIATSCINTTSESSAMDSSDDVIGTSDVNAVVKARDIINSNAFIDFDPEMVAGYAAEDIDWETKHPAEFQLSCAALYRFYSNIDTTSYDWKCTKTAKGLNMSETVYNYYVDNEERLNREFADSRAKGIKTIRTIPAKYLEGLLSM